MKYTHYFGVIIKNQGWINLPPNEVQRMMNIVHLEGVVYGLKRAKESYKDTNLYYRYDTLIGKHEDLLEKLTLKESPDQLLRKMASMVE